MYTRLKQEKLIEVVRGVIKEAFDEQRNIHKAQDVWLVRKRCRRVSKRTFYFTATPKEENKSRTAHYYSEKDVQELVSDVVSNTYLEVGDVVYKQEQGLPMGGNASPDLANLFCYGIEKQYIEDLLAQGKEEEAKKHLHTCRYIDDFLTWGVDPPPKELYGMDYQCTGRGDVEFLGNRIRRESGKKKGSIFLRLSILEKPEGTKYPHYKNTAPSNQIKGIVKGGWIRAARQTNNFYDFKVEVERVVRRGLSRGHCAKVINKAWYKWVNVYYPKERNPRTREELQPFVQQVIARHRKNIPQKEEREYINGPLGESTEEEEPFFKKTIRANSPEADYVPVAIPAINSCFANAFIGVFELMEEDIKIQTTECVEGTLIFSKREDSKRSTGR
eukprot:TRINITY_DN2713_c2_g1_i1.p1 TRINITY_DN2713_c2_g1~~TRINITY_DN2713_c2_g1_i1.p1  ORF type:complete len:388 (+),score=26.71 TRINITY_DN2713_c2_g1_i1:502-1665(+)